MDQLEKGVMPVVSGHANRDEIENIESLKNRDFGAIEYIQLIDSFGGFLQLYIHTDREQFYFGVVYLTDQDELTLVNLEPGVRPGVTGRKISPEHD